MRMAAFLLRRLLGLIGVLLGMSVLIFGIIHILPGNVAYAILGLFRWETLVSMAGALPIVAAGLFLGGRVQARFSQRVFVWLISALLIVSGAGLLFKG